MLIFIQKACEYYGYTFFCSREPMNANMFHLYFHFLKNLFEWGVPLNSVNAQGLYRTIPAQDTRICKLICSQDPA